MTGRKIHAADVEDALRDTVQELLAGDERYRMFEFDRDDPKLVYLSVNTLAMRLGRSRYTVNRIVMRKWASRRAPVAGKGTPMDWSEFLRLLDFAGVGDRLDELREICTPKVEERLSAPQAHLQALAARTLVVEAERLIAGEPTALAHERGNVRFSPGDAAERAGEHHMRIAHGVRYLKLWAEDAGRGEYAKLRRFLGRPVDARRLLEILRAEGVDVEAVAKRLLEIRGARERAKLPGRYALPSRAGTSAKRTEPDPDLEAFEIGFGRWLEREHKSGRISDAELYGNYAELRARYADLCGGR